MMQGFSWECVISTVRWRLFIVIVICIARCVSIKVFCTLYKAVYGLCPVESVIKIETGD